MESRGIFLNLSPLDHRYSLSNPELFRALSGRLGEEASVRACARVEVALLKTLLRQSSPLENDPGLFSALDRAAEEIDPEEVYAEEKKTQHNVRALVNVLKRRLPQPVRHLLHLGATSADILDTASSLRFRDTMRK